jgi:hypothetical protein
MPGRDVEPRKIGDLDVEGRRPVAAYATTGQQRSTA